MGNYFACQNLLRVDRNQFACQNLQSTEKAVKGVLALGTP
jgi:hypothetical protein